jgi:hypothetical protein
MQTIDRLSYCEGTYLFWSENHSGQNSKGYEILSRVSAKYQPSISHNGWESLDETAQNVYRAWCAKESVSCEYDTIKYLLSDTFNIEDSCVDYFLDSYGSDTLEDTGLVNYDRSDFVNLDMCYTRDLIEFYNRNETELLAWVDTACEAYGYNSRLHLLEGETIETPDDFAAGLVNAAMTYLGRELLSSLEVQ